MNDPAEPSVNEPLPQQERHDSAPRRRTVVRTALWTVPSVTLATAAPAWAASETLEWIDLPLEVALATVVENVKVRAGGNAELPVSVVLPAEFVWADTGLSGPRTLGPGTGPGDYSVPPFRSVTAAASTVLVAETGTFTESRNVIVTAPYVLEARGWNNATDYWNSEFRADFSVLVPAGVTVDQVHYNYYSATSTVGTRAYRAGPDGASTVQASVGQSFGVVAVEEVGSSRRLWVSVRGDSHHELHHRAMDWQVSVTWTNGVRTGESDPSEPIPSDGNTDAVPASSAPYAGASTLVMPLAQYWDATAGRPVGINAWDASAGGSPNSQTGWGNVVAPGGSVDGARFYLDATSSGRAAPANQTNSLYYQFVGPDGGVVPSQPALQPIPVRTTGGSQVPAGTSFGARLSGQITFPSTGYWRLLVWPQVVGGSLDDGIGWNTTEPGHQIGSVFVFGDAAG